MKEDDAIRRFARMDLPIFAVPPSKWAGDVFLSGASGSEDRPSAISLLYVEDASMTHHRKGLQVTTISAEGALRNALYRQPEEHAFTNEIVNFVNRFDVVGETELPRAVSHDQTGQVQPVLGRFPGPRVSARRVIETPAARFDRFESFVRYPRLRLARGAASGGEIIVLSWRVTPRSFHDFVAAVARVTPGSDLFDELARRDAASRRRIDAAEHGER